MPILKQLVSGSSGSKRCSRADLTVEMISAPLADFRHTMHIGRGGDAFGDTSFLSAPRDPTNQLQNNGFLPRRLSGSKRLQSERNLSYMLTANSTTSLPSARDKDVSTSIDFLETDRRYAVMVRRSMEEKEQCFGGISQLPMFTPPLSRGMKHAESILSFQIDLGPSMLGDVLGVMDQSEQLQQNLFRTEDQEQDRKMPSPLQCVSTSSSRVTEEKTQQAHESQMCSPTYSVNINDKDFLFMDEDEDEIRV